MATTKKARFQQVARRGGKTEQKPRVGRTPDVLRKGGPMTDKTKVIPRKDKSLDGNWAEQMEDHGIGDQ